MEMNNKRDDVNFASAMIKHHEMAVKMSKELLRNGNPRAKMKAFAEKVIKDQREEILWRKSWLKLNE